MKIFCDLDFDLQGHPRSKVMMSNESLIMISYLTLIVTICLTCSVSEIWSIQVFCLISLIRLINFIRSWSKVIGLYSSGRWDRFLKMKEIEEKVKKLSRWQNCSVQIFMTSIETLLVVQGQRSPRKMKDHIWVRICDCCNNRPIWHRFRDINLWS